MLHKYRRKSSCYIPDKCHRLSSLLLPRRVLQKSSFLLQSILDGTCCQVERACFYDRHRIPENNLENIDRIDE